MKEFVIDKQIKLHLQINDYYNKKIQFNIKIYIQQFVFVLAQYAYIKSTYGNSDIIWIEFFKLILI